MVMPMVLLAADAEGYSNLCQLTTLRHLGALDLGQNATFAEDGAAPSRWKSWQRTAPA